MQFGFGAPVSGPLSGPRDLARIVGEGEALGYDYCTISDHIAIPRDMEAKYPYSDTGEFPGRAGGDRHEQLTAVAFVAAKTSKLRLVTSVTVVPHRPPVLTAKVIATIDVLSEGRFTWGIGVGWCREEFEAIGTEPFDERGAVTDETIAVCRELWTKDEASFDGDHVRFSPTWQWPKPVQRPGPPILVGGAAGPKLFEHIAEYGDGWMPIGGSGVAAALPQLRDAVAARGRDPESLEIVPFWSIPDPGKLDHYESIGVTECIFHVPSATADQVLPLLDKQAAMIAERRS